nr:MAG TPA_asm: hypothetical protein [Caudoviricetes sp.]
MWPGRASGIGKSTNAITAGGTGRTAPLPGSPKGKSLRDNCGLIVLPAVNKRHPLSQAVRPASSPSGGAKEGGDPSA